MTDVVVVGGGHNGLCAAAYLARAGLEVVVVERRAELGGAAASEELVPGFRFSTCAYALHLLHETVVVELGLELDLIPLPPRLRLVPDGAGWTCFGEDAAEAAAWNRDWSRAAEVVDRFLLGPPPPREVEAAARAAGLEQFVEGSLLDLLRSSFASPRERAAFAPSYFEGDPAAPGSPLTYAYLETSRRRPDRVKGLPRAGMGAVAAAFARAATEAGARLLTSSEVERILVERGTARGVELAGGEVVEAKAVVSNADPKRTFLRLVAPIALPAGFADAIASLDPGLGAAKLHCALSEAPDVAAACDDPCRLGLLQVAPSVDWYERVWPVAERPLLELQIPTFLDPSLAPAGCHCLSIFLPFAPPRLDAEALLAQASRVVPNLRRALVAAVLNGPADRERRLRRRDPSRRRGLRIARPERRRPRRTAPRGARLRIAVSERTSGQTIAGLFGVGFLVLGVIGFVPEITTGYTQFHTWERHSHAELFGVFDVSVFQNAVHLAFGVAGLVLSRTPAGAWAYLVGGGVASADLAVYGLLIDRGSRANFVPLDAPGCWLHLGLGVVMIALGLATARAAPRALPA